MGCQRINGKGEVETRHFDLGGFNEVDLSNEGHVELVTDVNSFVEVETHGNLFEALDLKVDGNELKIKTKKGYSIGKYDKLTYYVHALDIRKVDVSGSGSMNGGGGFAVVDHFEAEVSGSGDISITGIVAQTVDADVSGSGNISLAGNTPNAHLEVSGSGNIRAFELVSWLRTRRHFGQWQHRNHHHRQFGRGHFRQRKRPVQRPTRNQHERQRLRQFDERQLKLHYIYFFFFERLPDTEAVLVLVDTAPRLRRLVLIPNTNYPFHAIAHTGNSMCSNVSESDERMRFGVGIPVQ